MIARIQAALRADPWWGDLADRLPTPVICAVPGVPNWRVAGWRNPDVLLTPDHLTAIARAVERVRDVVDWDRT